jgi:hypothetical protein
LIAVLIVALLQLGISAFYWIPDARARVALAPTWDIVGLMLLIVVWSGLPKAPRWVERGIAIALTGFVFLTLVVASGQGFLKREFGRELILVLDIVYVKALIKMLYDAEPLWLFIPLMVLLAGGLALAVLGPHAGLRHLRRFVAVRRQRQIAFTVAAIGYLGIGGALAGVHAPVAREVADQLSLVWNLKDPLAATAHKLEDEAAINQSLALNNAQSDRPLHVYLMIVESYGHAIFSDHPAYAGLPELLRQINSELKDAGYSSRSKYLRSPVFGGGSWMADATLLCGAPISNQKRFVSLFDSSVRCLPKILEAGGYRTVLAAPSTEQHEDRFVRTYAFNESYFKYDFHYAGPRFGWSFMPDQFVIDFIHRKEIDSHKNDPLFVTMILTSSHTPWSSVPPLVDWDQIGDGAMYNHVTPKTFDNRLMSGRQYEAGYFTSIKYSLAAIAGYMQRLPKEDRSLFIVLGDHQPQQPIASRWSSDRWVPVHVFSRDERAVERFARFGYDEGIFPTAKGEPAGHERLLFELLSACGAEAR